MTILDKIVASTRERVERDKAAVPESEMRRRAEALAPQGDFPFEKALGAAGMSFICEVKKASPSKGVIAVDFPYLDIAREYEDAGASAISILTEPEYFLGKDAYLTEIRGAVSIPLLRKDFTVDAFQIYQAKAIGADAVLLICAILTDRQLGDYLALCRSLGLSALVETRDEAEMERALKAGAGIVGVNNRDLRTFQVDTGTSLRLRGLAGPEVLFVSESGIRDGSDVRLLEEHGVDAVLVGETLMRAENKKSALQALKNKT